jgi:thiol-disulfide isomerase/thioredoxin
VRRVLILCLLSVAVGCSSTAKNRTTGNDSLPPREFVGTPSAPEREAPAGNLAARPLGMLAGQVVDADGRRVANASIQVIEHGTSGARARLSVTTDRNGYFDIPGLEKSRRYQLVASVDRAGVQHIGKTTAVASNVRVAIYLTEIRSEAGTPTPSPDRPPAASLGAPTRPGEGVGKAVDPPPVSTDPTRTATREREFDDLPPPATATVPGPPGRDQGDDPSRKPIIPPPPMMTPEAGVTTPLPGATPASSVPPAVSRERETPAVRVIPSCVKVGQVVQELALYDSHGQPWELSKKGEGKLLLLDFWTTTCVPCRAALPKLSEWQTKYGPQGLQVVGVLCDRGKTAQRRAALTGLMEKTGVTINYPVLFSDEGDCPVRRHMEVFMFPTLVLLDETGKVVWKGVGHDPERAAELEKRIKRMLSERR